MSITISIDATYPPFAALPPEQLKKVAVGIGPKGMNSHLFSFDTTAPVSFGTLGDCGMDRTAPTVSYTRPLTFSHEAFGVFGNVAVTDYSASRLATLLADYVMRGVLIVTDNSGPTVLTPAEILKFSP